MSSSACLSAMPWFVKQKIVIKTDFVTRLSLSRCSKEFHKLSETSILQYHTVGLLLTSNQSIRLILTKYEDPDSNAVLLETREQDIFSVEYRSQGGSCLVVNKTRTAFICGKNFMELAILEFMKILENKNAHFETLIINTSFHNFVGRAAEHLVRMATEAFSNFEGSLNVESFQIGVELNQQGIKTMLDIVKPGILKKLYLFLEDGDQRMEEVMEMEQWKQLQHLEVMGWNMIPAERLVGIPSVCLYTSLGPSMSQESFNALIRGILSEGSSFEKFYLDYVNTLTEQPMYIDFLRQIPNAIPGKHEREKYIQVENEDWKLHIYVCRYQNLTIENVPLEFQSDLP